MQVKFQSIIELQYNHVHVLTLNYTLTILHIKSSHHNFEVIMNVNRLNVSDYVHNHSHWKRFCGYVIIIVRINFFSFQNNADHLQCIGQT